MLEILIEFLKLTRIWTRAYWRGFVVEWDLCIHSPVYAAVAAQYTIVPKNPWKEVLQSHDWQCDTIDALHTVHVVTHTRHTAMTKLTLHIVTKLTCCTATYLTLCEQIKINIFAVDNKGRALTCRNYNSQMLAYQILNFHPRQYLFTFWRLPTPTPSGNMT